MSRPARVLPALLLALGTAAGCAAPPAGPGLLSPAQIEAAAAGTSASPSTVPLETRAARLEARAAALRRAGGDAAERRRLRARADGLVRT